ncbi:MAG: hypothetical protein R3229_00990 [Alphaproteobacteria bacterium]|nr:hypothetical protein [Alphaproteobacteria bacterium]
MNDLPDIPDKAATAVNDLLDNCACIQAGQNVLILAANDGLNGGANIVDQATVGWIADGVRKRGADAKVMWVDMPDRPQLIWPDIATRETVWRIPGDVKAAMKEADILISHVFDLSSEEHLKELPETLREYELPMVRNMATTASLLMTDWARTPHDLIAEIRYRMGELVVAGEPWELTHPNGTHLTGKVGPGPKTRPTYVYWRRDGFYRPFPDGIYPAVNPVDCEGIYIFDRMMPVWAHNIGVPPHFSEPVTVTVKDTHIVKVEGGAEADTLRAFLAALANSIGEDHAYEMRAPHGGVHPSALISPSECADEDYREFIASFHPSSLHIHLGQGGRDKDFPYNLHTACEIRGGTLTIGGRKVHDGERMAVLDHPRVLEVAGRTPNLPGLGGISWQSQVQGVA